MGGIDAMKEQTWVDGDLATMDSSLRFFTTKNGVITVKGTLDSDGDLNITGNITGANLSGTNTGDQDLAPYAKLDGTNRPFTGNLNVGGDIKVGASSTLPYRLLVSESGITPEDSAVINDAGKARTVSVQGAGGAYFHGKDITNDIEYAMGVSDAASIFIGSLTAHPVNFRVGNATKLTIGTDIETRLLTSTDGSNKLDLYNAQTRIFPYAVVAGINPMLKLVSNSTTINNGVGIDFVGSTDVAGITARIGAIRMGSGGFGDFTISTVPSGGALTERVRVTSAGDIKIPADSKKLYLGAGDDVYHSFTGSLWDFNNGAYPIQFSGAGNIHIGTTADTNSKLYTRQVTTDHLNATASGKFYSLKTIGTNDATQSTSLAVQSAWGGGR